MLESKRKQLLSAIGGLDCASKTRLHHYRRHLASDRDPKIFDDRMRDMLLELAHDPDRVRDTIKYLDSIGFNQSKYEFSKMKDQLAKFAGSNHPYYGWQRNFQSAKQALIKEVRAWQCEVVQYRPNNIEQFIPKLTTHAGYSYLVTGKRRKGEYVEGMFGRYKAEEEQALKAGTFGKPIMLGSRTQASGAFDTHTGERTGTYKAKTRLVSMIDINVIMAERRFQYPIQPYLSNCGWYAGGKNDISIAGSLHYYQNFYKNWVSIDYSSFDQTISDWLIHEAFDVVKAMFRRLSPIDENLLDVIKYDFISKMFVAEDDHLVFSDKGIPSGSMFTQIIGSICNRLMIDTYLNSVGVTSRGMMVMGDDNIFFCNPDIDLDHLSSYLEHNFGVEVNASKCAFGGRTDHPEFLSRVWSPKIFRDPSTLIAKLCYPEHFRDYDAVGETPFTVIMQYYQNFPAGVEILLDRNKIIAQRAKTPESNHPEGYKIFSGLARYRMMFDRRLSYY